MYNISIPHLFEIKTNNLNMSGFYLFDFKQQNCNLYLNPDKLAKTNLSYAYEVMANIEIPVKFDAKYAWYLFNDNKIYYKRPILNKVSLNLIYDLKNKKMQVSPFYHSVIRFELGNIWPAGKILANYISYDLQKIGFGTFHGTSFKYKEKTVCVFAPGGNYKTSLLKYFISKGAEYVSGDKLIIKDGYVYFLSPLKDDKIIIDFRNIKTYRHKIDYIFFIQRSKSQLCVDLNDVKIIESYLQSFNIFNFLGSGWALNFRKIIDKYIPINNWFEYVGINNVRHLKVIKEENFENLINIISKELK